MTARKEIKQLVDNAKREMEASTERLREADRKIASVSDRASRHLRRRAEGLDEITGRIDIPPDPKR